MKARVKATGEIVEVKSKVITSFTGKHRLKYIDQDTGVSYFEEELFFPKDLVDDPDYWTRLEHTYAGMAMQGISEKYFKEYRDYCAGFGDMDEDEAKGAMKDFANAMADVCYYFAHALVEKMKNQSV